MGVVGAVLPFSLLLAFGYLESPGWLVMGIAAGMLGVGTLLIVTDIWDEVSGFCYMALLATGVIFCWFNLAALLDGRGIDLFGRPNWILLLYGLVYAVLLVVRGEEEE